MNIEIALALIAFGVFWAVVSVIWGDIQEGGIDETRDEITDRLSEVGERDLS